MTNALATPITLQFDNGRKLETNPGQVIAWRHAIKLEMLGMKHSGGSVTAQIKKAAGMPRNTRKVDVLALVDEWHAQIKQAMGV